MASSDNQNGSSNDEQRRGFMSSLKSILGTADGWVGSYDYRALCMPRLPCFQSSSSKNRTIFFGVNDSIPILLALLMGFQHALAMAGGVITVPRIISGAGVGHLNFGGELQAYLISSALVVCGLMSIIQIVRVRLARGYWMGTGLISMSGTSFTFLPVAEATFSSLEDEGVCVSSEPCPEAYGRWLGTVAVGALLEILLSFVPPKSLCKIFPPVVSGSTVFLIGAALIGVGLKNWAGGAGPCYTYSELTRLGVSVEDIPQNLVNFADCPSTLGPGDRHYPWGSARWIGLGFFVFSIIVLIEFFGSPFLRNTQVIVGLVAGIVLSTALGYLDDQVIEDAPIITFPLVERFSLGFYPPAIIPVLIAYLVSAVESIGDISASAEASRVETTGEVFETRLQGGLLADGFNSLIAALLTASPTTTFSENNGVISMTRTANRFAGIAGACWLVIFGIFGKVGGVFGATPNAVIGGMTTFLFANVAVSGVNILSTINWDRRNRFILAITLGLGVGVIIEPKIFSYFIPQATSSFWKAVRQGVVIVLETGFSIGAVAAAVLNAVLPDEGEEVSPEEFKKPPVGTPIHDTDSI